MRHRRELHHILSLALPVIIAELGWMVMGLVDTMMVGHLGPTAIGAVSLGNAMFDVAAICGIGFLLGLDTVVSQSFGAKKQAECDAWLWQGLWLALATAPVMMLAVAASEPLMRRAGVNAGVLFEAIPYMHALNWSLPPLLLYAAFRRYLQGMSLVRPVMFALVSANLVNAAGNYLLIDRFGVAGVGWSTCLARIYMAGVLAGYTFLRESAILTHFAPPRMGAIRELLRLGCPPRDRFCSKWGYSRRRPLSQAS